jgi:hypothetical protein
MVINPKIVGQSAVTIAAMAGLKVPPKDQSPGGRGCLKWM